MCSQNIHYAKKFLCEESLLNEFFYFVSKLVVELQTFFKFTLNKPTGCPEAPCEPALRTSMSGSCFSLH